MPILGSFASGGARGLGGLRTFRGPPVPAVELVIVGGGGAGLNWDGYTQQGGGGGGGFRTNASYSITGGITYTITVGGSGSATSFGSFTAAGGGNGARGPSGFPQQANAQAGGSGGGGAGSGGTATGGLGNTPSTSPSQGNNGGNASGNTAGGGGAGGAGAQGSPGGGGAAISNSITGSAVLYAGGAGGGNASTRGTAGVGRGGGGGGAAQNFSDFTLAPGTAGIVIFKYVDTAGLAEPIVTGSPTITTSGGFKIYQFTGSGTVIF
jgi:hypothetical protein